MKERKKNNKKLTELLNDYSYELIIESFDRLIDRYKEILKKAYGDDLKQLLPRNEWSPEEKTLLISARARLKNIINNDGHFLKTKKTLFDEYDETHLLFSFEKLNETQQQILKEAYGDDLKLPLNSSGFTREQKNLLYNARRHLARKVKELEDGKTLLQTYFNDYEESQIYAVVKKMSPQHQQILKEAYGEDLKKPLDNSSFTEKQNKDLYNVRRRLRDKLRNLKENNTLNGTIYEIFNNYDEVQIDIAVEDLSKKHQLALKKICGEDLKKSINITDFLIYERNEIYNILRNIKENLMRNRKKNIHKTLYHYLSEFNIKQIDFAFLSLDGKKQRILKKAYGADLKQNIKLEGFTEYEKSMVFLARKELRNIIISSDEKLKTINTYFKNYTNAQIFEAFNLLSSEYRSVIMAAYGVKLNRDIQITYFSYKKVKLLFRALNEISYYLDKKVIIELTDEEISEINLKQFNLINFFEKYGFSKIEVLYCFTKLDNECSQLIKNVCGDNNQNTNNIFEIDVDKIKNILKQMHSELLVNKNSKFPVNQIIKLQPLTLCFPGYSVEEIKIAIGLLDNHLIKELVAIYKGNLNQSLVIFVNSYRKNQIEDIILQIESNLLMKKKTINPMNNEAMIVKAEDISNLTQVGNPIVENEKVKTLHKKNNK